MHDRPRYRSNAADCLLAAQDASQPNNRLLHLLMAGFWLSLAHQNAIARAAEPGSTRDPIMDRHAPRTPATTLPERESDEMTSFIPPIAVPLFIVGLIALRVASLSYF
jgi:hypothetical protein